MLRLIELQDKFNEKLSFYFEYTISNIFDNHFYKNNETYLDACLQVLYSDFLASKESFKDTLAFYNNDIKPLLNNYKLLNKDVILGSMEDKIFKNNGNNIIYQILSYWIYDLDLPDNEIYKYMDMFLEHYIKFSIKPLESVPAQVVYKKLLDKKIDYVGLNNLIDSASNGWKLLVKQTIDSYDYETSDYDYETSDFYLSSYGDHKELSFDLLDIDNWEYLINELNNQKENIVSYFNNNSNGEQNLSLLELKTKINEFRKKLKLLYKSI